MAWLAKCRQAVKASNQNGSGVSGEKKIMKRRIYWRDLAALRNKQAAGGGQHINAAPRTARARCGSGDEEAAAKAAAYEMTRIVPAVAARNNK